MIVDRILASVGSALGNLTLFGAVIAGWPGIPAWTSSADARSAEAPIIVRVGFSPFIVDSVLNGRPSQEGESCPWPAVAARQFQLLNAPLPANFDTSAWPDERLYACVRVNKMGEVLDVSLIGISEPATGNAVIEKVRRDWSLVRRDWPFSPNQQSDGGWAKVRINSGPAEPIRLPDLLFE